jgi:hypothetical protein
MYGNQSVYDDMTNAERQVADFLNFIGFWWSYEQPVFVYDDKGRPRLWTPDLYIPSLGLYIEVVGNERLGNYEFRKEVYGNNNTPIIFVYIQDYNWRELLVNEINRIHQFRWEQIRNIRF